jgi:hypothetical protein
MGALTQLSAGGRAGTVMWIGHVSLAAVALPDTAAPGQ